MTTYQFDFADPLALELAEGQNEESTTDLQPGDLKITILQNDLPSLVSQESIDYSQGIGYGSIVLSIDGVAAFE